MVVQPSQDRDGYNDPARTAHLTLSHAQGYKLYSDGSIEAQRPQGALRFGSITDLRNHIEQNSCAAPATLIAKA
jgi:hypothetical protein